MHATSRAQAGLRIWIPSAQTEALLFVLLHCSKVQAAERVGKSPKLTMKSRLAASRDDRFTPLRRRVKQAASENSERKVRVTLTLEETDR